MNFTVESSWKEVVIYREGTSEHYFVAGWGVEPPVLYVRSEATWDEQMPEFLRGRREQILDRLAAHSGHRIEVDDRYA